MPDVGNEQKRAGFPGRFASNPLALAGAATVACIGVVALLAPLLPLVPPDSTNLDRRLLVPFSLPNLLGTDHLGRDILARLVWGARTSLGLAVVATAVAALIGSTIGIVAGYAGRWVDSVLMRMIDVLLAFPYMLLALGIVAALGPGLGNALVAVAVVNIPFFARAVRGTTISQAGLPYVEAARLSGQSSPAILIRELLPNVMPTVVITIATTLGWMILETAGLSFLGLGAQPPTADLGSMLGEGRTVFVTAPHVAVLPGLVIVVAVVGINLVADGVRDAIDPRLGGASPTAPRTSTEVGPLVVRPRAPEGDDVREVDMPVVEVRNLVVEFETRSARGPGRRMTPPATRALDGVSFHVRRGECLGLVGESGSGKSVAALSLARLVASPPGRIVAGEVRLGGDDVLAMTEGELRQLRGRTVAYVFQDPSASLTPVIPIGKQLVEAIRPSSVQTARDRKRKALALLDRVRIPDAMNRFNAYPHELSGGQKQRVAIAMALANRPRLLVADEPTTALDVRTQASILELLDELGRDDEMAMLFITHDLALVGEIAHRVAVMHAGKIVETGETGDVVRRPREEYTRQLVGAIPRLGDPARWAGAGAVRS